MSYRVEAYWQEHVASEHETVEEAVAEAHRIALAHPGCTPMVQGPGFVATVTRQPSEDAE